MPYRSGLALDPPRMRGAQHFQKTPAADHYRASSCPLSGYAPVENTRWAHPLSCGGEGPTGCEMMGSGSEETNDVVLRG